MTVSERILGDKGPRVASTSSSTPLADQNARNDRHPANGDEHDEGGLEYESDEATDDFSFTGETSISLASSESSLGTESISSHDTSLMGAGLADTDIMKIAHQEAKAAKCGRGTSIFILVAVLGVLLPFALYQVASTRQETSFVEMFDSMSDDLMAGLGDNLIQTFVALDAMATDVSLATSSSDWPQITIPAFSTFSVKAQHSATALQSVFITTIVTDAQRLDYEAYVQINNQEWISRSEEWDSAAEEFDKKNRRLKDQPVDFSNGIPDQVYRVKNNVSIVSPGPGPYSPIRHMYPFRQDTVNFDVASNDYLHDELLKATSNASAVIGKFMGDETMQKLLFPESTVSDVLFVTLAYPITESLTPTGAVGVATGLLVAMVSWIDLFSSILPSKAQGVVCVVENTCGQLASFRIDGRTSRFLGLQDHHDSKFSSYRNSYNLEDLSLADRTVSRFPLQEACPYRVHVYPSGDTEAEVSSYNPLLLVTIAMGFFLFTIFVFLVYDRFMERRNRAVLVSAVEARAIISSLFPANVRDRLLASSREERQRKKKLQKLNEKLVRTIKRLKGRETSSKDPPPDVPDSPEKLLSKSPAVLQNVQPVLEAALLSKEAKLMRHPKHELKNLLAATTMGLCEDEDFGLAKPIADLFPHTSVIFADIVGFTAWSSEREPQDVFLLLQTIYHAFDRLARRRGVFKVETIGDCYVAITGLPDPQPDHAVRMTKFAKECIVRMTEVTKKLEVRLGPDTSELSMRMGVHSGPVTAGVLQGEKSRFQLFGDTVNTASRMESTGDKDRIQLSKATADLLVAAGKSSWIKPREDLVHAKGKGFVQTYWLVSRESVDMPQSSDDQERGAVSKRTAPPRSRSGFSSAPTRGVQRTVSDSIHKVIPDNSAQNQKLREERLIQWQVELFARLLVKIVAARGGNPDATNKKGGGRWGGITKGSNHSMSRSFDHLSLHDISDDDDDGGGIDTSKVDLPVKVSKRDSFFRLPSRLTSARKNESFDTSRASVFTKESALDVSIDTLATLNDIGGASEYVSVSTDIHRIQRTRPPAGVVLDGSFDDLMINSIVIDEVAEIIRLPKFSPSAIKAFERADVIQLDDEVMSQLRHFIGTVAQMYRSNPFHCFEHACHVSMATNKFLNRIVIPENVDYERESSDIASDLHTYTYGITSDPLTQFAIVFSALVHDVDHRGVPNGQLAREDPAMAAMYRNTSLAEQKSVDLTWGLFTDPRYRKLQDCIAANTVERVRFRQLLVNCVIATDIFEPTMKALRNNRWDKAFHKDLISTSEVTDALMEEDRNTKATIVIEHIIQASDVAHTMQHWHIYQKWNERLFNEMYSAFECGRAANNPADGWYKGELWFFDNYVIPLAKKLEECKVFGVASAECLDYATANRNEWSVKGEEVVSAMVDRYTKGKTILPLVVTKQNTGVQKPPRRVIERKAP